VYATCSILNEENVEQIAHFITSFGLELHGPMFASVPSEGGMDGMFGAVLQRKKAH
jgi:16S rRNA C967 or C1407 C5-methylase (RsmB/RsmF family)